MVGNEKREKKWEKGSHSAGVLDLSETRRGYAGDRSALAG